MYRKIGGEGGIIDVRHGEGGGEGVHGRRKEKKKAEK